MKQGQGMERGRGQGSPLLSLRVGAETRSLFERGGGCRCTRHANITNALHARAGRQKNSPAAGFMGRKN